MPTLEVITILVLQKSFKLSNRLEINIVYKKYSRNITLDCHLATITPEAAQLWTFFQHAAFLFLQVFQWIALEVGMKRFHSKNIAVSH